MKRHKLSRREANRLQKDSSGLAEELAADAYQGFSVIGVENFDISRERSVGEVKSTATRLQSGRKGRFRLWKSQHEKLLRYDRDATAYYVFVLYDVSSRKPVARMVRKKPADVGNIVGARGGWNRSGHSQGQQHKLPYGAVF